MMQRKLFSAILVSGMLLSGVFQPSLAAGPLSQPATAAATVHISGPYSSGNLAVYLIHGQDQVKTDNILTLQEALAQKKIVVHETGDVNQLAVENLSDSFVFIQSGDIVKGGQQDRTMEYDLMLKPHSGRVPLPAYCVEHGRWSGRSGEAVSAFGSSNNAVSGKALKAAIQGAAKALPRTMAGSYLGQGPMNQGAVWDAVSQQQSKLERSAGGSVKAKQSESSMQLTLEHQRVKQSSASHISKLANIVEGKKDVIGYAFAVNGKINSADTYASSALFKKVWPKLLRSTAAEAVAETQAVTAGAATAAPSPAPAARSVDLFIQNAERAAKQQKRRTSDIETTQQESKDGYLFKTRWFSAPRKNQIVDDRPVIHSNYLAN